MNTVWKRQDSGWYVANGIGGIFKEIDGWYFYPIPDIFYPIPNVEEGAGPHKTLLEAKQQVEVVYRKRYFKDGRRKHLRLVENLFRLEEK